MTIIDDGERTAYLNSQYYRKPIYEDFTPFYITVAICSVLAAILFIINIALGCCSRYSAYWNDRHTGNRWIVSLWTSTPHKQPALDYDSVDPELVPQKIVYETPSGYNEEYTQFQHQHVYYSPKHTAARAAEYLELHHTKKESDI